MHSQIIMMVRYFFSCILLLLINSPLFAAQTIDIKIGVLSHRGDIATAINWGDTAKTLSNQLPGYDFKIVPLDFDEVENKIRDKSIHFLLVNPSIYVEMEVRHRISRIATLSRVINGKYQNQFAGVLFTTRDHSEIKTLNDIKGKKISAVDPNSLGGFQMISRELSENGIDISTDLRVSFAGIHDNVVKAVLEGKADVGTVRTGILESMAQAGQIDLQDFHIIHQQVSDKFTQLHSTRLYPEWPFSKLQHTSDELAQRVAIALMEMHNFKDIDESGVSRNRWSIPLEYQPVHEILQYLHLSPYDQEIQFTVMDALKKYWYVILSTLIIFVLLSIIILLVIRLNRALKKYNQRLERQYSLILDSVADGIYGVDMEGNSTFVNKAMETITGWSAQSIIGKNQHAILHHTRANGEQHPGIECPVYKTFMDQKTRFIEDDIFWRKDGSSFPVDYSSNPLKDENNNTIGSVVIFRDISERKKAEMQTRKLRHELAHMARVSTMGEMASGMAHELNQPLTAISTYADACMRLIESPQTDENKLSDTLEIISLQAKRAGAIIKQLRNFIRKEMPGKSQVDINLIIREVLVLIRPSLNEHGISLQLQLSHQLPNVEVQHIQIDQVILNLVKNAIEAMSIDEIAEKTLTIKTELKDNTQVSVSIADTGKGVDDKIQEKLFTPFATSKKSGMGLGLSISKGIINQHGGDLLLETVSGSGSVFKFTLPVKNGSKLDG